MSDRGVGTTITQHLLSQQRKNPEATGAFTTLLNELIVAAKVISREVNKAGLADILGATGKINVQNEQVQKLDIFSNQVVIERMQHIGQLCCMGSKRMRISSTSLPDIPRGIILFCLTPLTAPAISM